MNQFLTPMVTFLTINIFSIVQESGGLQKRHYSLRIGMMFPC